MKHKLSFFCLLFKGTDVCRFFVDQTIKIYQYKHICIGY